MRAQDDGVARGATGGSALKVDPSSIPANSV